MSEDQNATDPEDSRDAAWVTIETPLSKAALLAFCRNDPERLFRINSLLRFDSWQRTGENTYHMHARNLSNGLALSDGLRIVYRDGLKTTTTFQVQEVSGGTRLVVTDDYSGSPIHERRARADEVDRSLVQWGHDLRHFLARWQRWSRYAPWRWYMDRIWKPMSPMGRRVVFALVVISALEFVAFLMVMTIFVLELEHYVGL
jgi:hypothetical protein